MLKKHNSINTYISGIFHSFWPDAPLPSLARPCTPLRHATSYMEITNPDFAVYYLFPEQRELCW